MNNKNNKKTTIKFLLGCLLDTQFEYEFDSMFHDDRVISLSDKIKIIDTLDKHCMVSYHMHMLYIAYKNGAYELKRYAMRKIASAKKYINELTTIKEIFDDLNYIKEIFDGKNSLKEFDKEIED